MPFDFQIDFDLDKGEDVISDDFFLSFGLSLLELVTCCTDKELSAELLYFDDFFLEIYSFYFDG